MHSFMKSIVTISATVLLLAGCAAAKAEFQTTVTLENAGTDCDQDPNCWLPTQYGPKLVSGQSVSAFNEWPQKGDRVQVLCETTGERLSDAYGKTSNQWYGILVPSDKVVEDIQVKEVEGGYLGYVSALWLADKDATAPAC
ncbi:MAG: hypothetical protein JWO54_877 [Candidatus Saccharibacteria bacterium]|nr:hypothetical protein [Candidatus Saccharibacteria bacterium]